eukprot:TRINITY_DN470_c0_g2_i2.p1 TRINITY_DN470_c0_g2~~TRINITY_DN470_c0_g2_i2.p1  ORF type:complete len:801 (+),score=292.65 TRINITY_DN470_c0_g2_i2:65-2467(+)
MSEYDDEVDFSNIHLKVGEDDEDALLPVERRAAITQFRVFARLRPFISEELETIGKAELQSTIEMKGESTFPLNPANGWKPSKEFVFDRSLWSIPQEQELKPTPYFQDVKHESCVGQKEMYDIATKDETGVSMVDNAFMAINSCVLTYGQTSSGKTYTMMGNYGEGADPEHRGIIPRVCDELFAKVAERREFEAKKDDPKKRWELDVSVTFVEIYLEKVRDLLDPALRHRIQKQAVGVKHREDNDMKESLAAMKEARVRRDPLTGPFVEGIKHVPVHSWKDCEKVLERGSKHRTTAVTDVHDNSSRSHAIFTLTLTQKRKVSEDRSGVKYDTKSGRLNLVDLAGSERGGGTSYVHEAIAINKSLMALRRVIDSLVDRQEKIFERQAAELEGRHVPQHTLPHVPYMDSILTQLLEDSVGGNAKTVMIANMTPYHEYYEETLRTLEWSHKASKLSNFVGSNKTNSDIVGENFDGKIQYYGQQLKQQKINVDNLTEELNRRQKLIENLEDKNEKCSLRIANLESRFQDSKQTRAATIIQLAMYLHNFRQMRARRRTQVVEAEEASATARKDLRALEEKHEALVDALLRHNITMSRIQKKADEVAISTDKTIAMAETQQQRQPDDLRKELAEKQKDVQVKKDELLGLQGEQTDAEKLLVGYQEQRDKENVKREGDREAAAEAANQMKLDVLNEIMGDANGDYAEMLGGKVKLGDEEVPLFECGLDGRWVPSADLEKQLKGIEEQKKESDTQLASAQKEKQAAEGTKADLKKKVADEKSKVSKLESETNSIQQQIDEAKKKGCCG